MTLLSLRPSNCCRTVGKRTHTYLLHNRPRFFPPLAFWCQFLTLPEISRNQLLGFFALFCKHLFHILSRWVCGILFSIGFVGNSVEHLPFNSYFHVSLILTYFMLFDRFSFLFVHFTLLTCGSYQSCIC